LFKDNEHWKDNPYVITEYCFGVEILENPKLSNEHKEYKWCSYEEAYRLFRYDSNRTALWELNKRLEVEH
jgi:dATP pyrophosphohydrolase